MGSRTFFILSFGFSTFFEFPTIIYFFSIKKMNLGDFPGGPVARTLRSLVRDYIAFVYITGIMWFGNLLLHI